MGLGVQSLQSVQRQKRSSLREQHGWKAQQQNSAGLLPRQGQGNAFPASSCRDTTGSSRPRDMTPGATGAMSFGQESHETPGEARGQGAGRQALDEGGVQLARFMVIVGTSLKELLDQGGFLLLQLGDAFALVCHLLGEKPVLLFQHVDGLLGAC